MVCAGGGQLPGERDLRRQAVEMFDDAFAAGWDKEYGGMLYFVDCWASRRRPMSTT